jgi:hypothetical protein
MGGLRIAVYDDRFVSEHGGEPEPTGLKQVHIMGPTESLRAFGSYLIAIAETDLPEDMIEDFEHIKGDQQISTTTKFTVSCTIDPGRTFLIREHLFQRRLSHVVSFGPGGVFEPLGP